MFYIYLSFSIFTVVMNIVLVLVVAFISEGNGGGWGHMFIGMEYQLFSSPDLPAVVRLIHMLCSSLRLRRLYDKRAVNDDDVPLVLGDNTGTKDIKLLVCEGLNPRVSEGLNVPESLGCIETIPPPPPFDHVNNYE